MDALNLMMANNKLPSDTKIRVRAFYVRSKELLRRQAHIALIQRCLSEQLTADVRFGERSLDIQKPIGRNPPLLEPRPLATRPNFEALSSPDVRN